MIDPPTLPEIRAAADRLREVVVHTPLVPLHNFDRHSDVLLKPEIHQVVTSFKIRGVFNAVASLDPEARAKGLSTVSAGNTAQALAWVGRHFGVPSRSLMPDTAPKTKIEAVKRYGGEPVLVPMTEVFRFLKEHLWEREPYAFIHPWTNRNVMIGHGSIGLEIMDDLPTVQTVFVPVGGGGLIGGVASAVKAIDSSVRVVAVEPEGCPSLFESFKQNKPASVDCDTICDGVAVPYMTAEVFTVLREIVDHVVLVSDEQVKKTVRRLALGNRLVVEPAGALAVAAALSIPVKDRGRCVCILSGGSIDTDQLLEILTAGG
ncbi:MAG: pyridoxal-phosphate dependent enzyme [Planctomycetes bacterium]|nr:pyridoxal-phosphate dependent enzyme [Planctomycetota bacterium]